MLRPKLQSKNSTGTSTGRFLEFGSLLFRCGSFPYTCSFATAQRHFCLTLWPHQPWIPFCKSSAEEKGTPQQGCMSPEEPVGWGGELPFWCFLLYEERESQMRFAREQKLMSLLRRRSWDPSVPWKSFGVGQEIKHFILVAAYLEGRFGGRFEDFSAQQIQFCDEKKAFKKWVGVQWLPWLQYMPGNWESAFRFRRTFLSCMVGVSLLVSLTLFLGMDLCSSMGGKTGRQKVV